MRNPFGVAEVSEEASEEVSEGASEVVEEAQQMFLMNIRALFTTETTLRRIQQLLIT